MKDSQKYIALLRGINVSGKNKISMSTLKELFEKLKCASVQTYIQSGNVVFSKSVMNPKKFAKEVEKSIQKELGLEVPVLAMDMTTINNILLKQPFVAQLKDNSKNCYYILLFDDIDISLMPTIPPESQDRWQLVNQVVYLYCPGGYGDTKWNNNYFEKKLKVQATTRNHATMQALLEMCQAE
jgi:uncharacterized protein (DUF1697 family)